MTLSDYQQLASRTASGGHRRERAVLGLCGEAGEVAEVRKKYLRGDYDDSEFHRRLIGELGDLKRGQDVRLLEHPGKVHGIIAQPPCTHFASSGARWWKGKGEEALIDGLQLVDACLRFVATCSPSWWVLENPVGRLRHYIGAPVELFDPYEFALYADHPDVEAYTKKTCLWGEFAMPERRPHPSGAILGSKMHKLPPGEHRAALRSATPQGWARAFYEANP